MPWVPPFGRCWRPSPGLIVSSFPTVRCAATSSSVPSRWGPLWGPVHNYPDVAQCGVAQQNRNMLKPSRKFLLALSQLNCLQLRRVVHELHDLHSRTPSSSALPCISCIYLDPLTRALHTRTVVHTRKTSVEGPDQPQQPPTTFLPTIAHWPALTCCPSHHPLPTQRRACDCRAVLTHVCAVSCDAQHSGPRYCGWTLLCRARRATFTG